MLVGLRQRLQSDDNRNPVHQVTRNLKARLTLDPSLSSSVFLCLVIILGAILRFYDLGAESYWFDEVYTLYDVRKSLGSILMLRAPVYVLLAHFWMLAFGTTEVATRSLSAFAGVGSIALMYAVGRELFGRRVGLLSALLIAISEFQIYHSQDYRYYSLFVFMTLISFLFCIRALKSRRLSHFVLYVLASILVFYTHTHGVFVLVAQNLYFLLQWNRHRNARVSWIFCQILIFLAIGPGLLPDVKATSTAGSTGLLEWIPDRPLWFPLRTLYWYVFPLRHKRSWVTVAVNFVAGIAFFLIGTLLFATWKGRGQWLASVKGLVTGAQGLSDEADKLLLVGCWLLCPIVLPLVLSKLIGPMYVHRYTISASPAFYLLLALGITTVRKVVPELVTVGAMVILIAPGLQHYYVTDVNEQWREAAAYVEEHAGISDVIVFAPDDDGWQRNTLYWYYQGNLPACGIDGELTDDEAIAGALERCTQGSSRFWLIMRGTPESIERFKAFFLDPGHRAMHLMREQKFMGISVYLFELTGR
jgi:mannosyltransferase